MVPEAEPATLREADDYTGQTNRSFPSSIQWSKAFPAAAITGFISALLLGLPVRTFGIGVVAAGYLCAALYRRLLPGISITRGLGGKLGAVSGALSFIVLALWMAVEIVFLHQGAEIRSQMIRTVEQSAAGNPDPNVQAAVAQLKSPEGLAVMMALGLFVTLLGLVVLGSIGGAVAGSPRPPQEP
jgi:hypothetical protein